MHIIIFLFPEMNIKSDSLRRQMIASLVCTLRKKLIVLDESVQVNMSWSEIEIITSYAGEEVIDILKYTPGIGNIIVVDKFSIDCLEDIAPKVCAIYADKIEGKSFAVRTKRRGKHSFKSVDIACSVGALLLEKTTDASVCLDNPEIEVPVRVYENNLFVEHRKIQGLGGFPLGNQGRVLSLISGGFDSAVSSYQALKRGLDVDYVFFNLGGSAHEIATFQIAEHIWKKISSTSRSKFISVPFHQIITEIENTICNGYKGIVLKRCMLRIASILAENHYRALVTGDAVCQVSSQTLENLSSIDSATKKLILRPLITTNKNDIITQARALGVEEMINQIPEYCDLFKEKPRTRTKIEKVEELDSIEDDLCRRVAQEAQTYILGEDNIAQVSSVKIHTVAPKKYKVIDVRHPQEIENQTLDRADICLAFFSIQKEFLALDSKKQYLLYCDSSVMSRLHAELLTESGFNNVGVYEPL